MKKPDETQTAYAIRLIREEERARCARLAEHCLVGILGDIDFDLATQQINMVRADIAKAIRQEPPQTSAFR